MIRNDLRYALAGKKPIAIQPLKAMSFLKFAEAATSNPSIAYALSDLERRSNPKHQQRLGKRGILKKRADDDDFEDLMGGVLNAPEYSYVTADGIGVIPIKGVIGKGLTYLEKALGCADIDDVNATLENWKDDPYVQEIFFDINSGGGTTTGLEELAKVIREYPKMTVAFADEDCGSAAFWIASQCKRVLATPSSSWGAVGVYIVVEDESAKFAEEGKVVNIIRRGDYKGMGVEGTTLSEKQADWMQYEVDELARRFIRDVKSVRLFVQDVDLQGQSFYGDIAATKGFVTGVVQSRTEAIDSIKAMRQTAMSIVAAGVQPTTFPQQIG